MARPYQAGLDAFDVGVRGVTRPDSVADTYRPVRFPECRTGFVDVG